MKELFDAKTYVGGKKQEVKKGMLEKAKAAVMEKIKQGVIIKANKARGVEEAETRKMMYHDLSGPEDHAGNRQVKLMSLEYDMGWRIIHRYALTVSMQGMSKRHAA